LSFLVLILNCHPERSALGVYPDDFGRDAPEAFTERRICFLAALAAWTPTRLLVAAKFFENSIQRPRDDPGTGSFPDRDFGELWDMSLLR